MKEPYPTTLGTFITREELVNGLWAMDYRQMKYEPQIWCVCNNKNCLYQQTLPISWTVKIEDKTIRCFECNRSFFNVASNEMSERLQTYYRKVVE